MSPELGDVAHGCVGTHASDRLPTSVERTSALEPSGAKLTGFLALALVNQALAFTIADRSELSTRLLHRAIDAGQLLALGLVSFFIAILAARVVRRLGRSPGSLRLRALLLAAGVAVVAVLALPEDLTNAAGRYGVPIPAMVAAGASFFALLLGGTVFLRSLPHPAVRATLGAAGLALAVTNGLVLEGDYPGIHLMLGWLAALLVAHAVEGLTLPARLHPQLQSAALALLALLSVATLAVPPPQAVRRRLLALPSALVAPFVAALQPESDDSDRGPVPREISKSPWFKKRKNAKPVPPSGALSLPEPKLVFFLTIDATRADVLDKKNAKKLPTLSRLKSKGAWFSLARSAASSTRPSMASVFTGRYYSQLRFKKRGTLSVLDDNGPRFPQLLTDAGVHTVSLPLLFRISAESGVGRGFETEIRDVRGASATVTKLIELAGRASGPTLLYAHFGEPHAPYQGKGNTPRERYLEDVRTVDRELGRLIAALNDAGLSQRALLVISADHGEAFMEHGVGNHARVIYEEVAHIPLIVYGPGVDAREIAEPVSLIDIAPTLLDLFGVPAPGQFMGQSLVPLLAGRDVSLERPIAIQATHGLSGLYVGQLKVIFDAHARTVEVYDLAEDPGEKHNLADDDDPKVRSAIQTNRLFMEVHGKARRSHDLGGE
jgi:hypothetical protein